MGNNDNTKTDANIELIDLELSWVMKIRIVAVLAVGLAVVGVFGFRFVAPVTDVDIVSITNGTVSAVDVAVCAGLAFLAGAVAAVIAVPYGRQIAPLAGAGGMMYWAISSGALGSVFQAGPSAGARAAVYAEMKYAGFVWGAIAAAGFVGAMLMAKILPKSKSELDKFQPTFKLPYFLVVVISVVGSVFIAHAVIGIIAQDISYPDAKLGSIVGNPTNLQIALAVSVGFGLAAFLAKLFLGADAIYSAMATVPLVYYISTVYSKSEILSYMSQHWAGIYFVRSAAAVLPVQVVAFGCVGAVAGYWCAVKFHLWRMHCN